MGRPVTRGEVVRMAACVTIQRRKRHTMYCHKDCQQYDCGIFRNCSDGKQLFADAAGTASEFSKHNVSAVLPSRMNDFAKTNILALGFRRPDEVKKFLQ